jgi:hypothetical protein
VIQQIVALVGAGFRLSCSTPLVTETTVIFFQDIQLTQETRPMQFSVIQQIAKDNTNLLTKLCRGRFSHANVLLFGSASSARQQGLQQLEMSKPAHSGKHISLTDQNT